MQAILSKNLEIKFPRPVVNIPTGSKIEIIDFFTKDTVNYVVFRFEGFTYISERDDIDCQIDMDSIYD